LTLLKKPPELRKSPEPRKPKPLGHPFPHAGLPIDTLAMARYKKAANHIHPVQTTLPKEYHILCHIPSNPLISLPPLPRHPPDFVPSEKFTEEWKEKMNINPLGFLWLEEHKLILFPIREQEAEIAGI